MTTMQEILSAAHRLSPVEQLEIITKLSQALQQDYAGKQTSLANKPRVLGLHQGLVTIADDFGAELPDSFWLGEDDAVSP